MKKLLLLAVFAALLTTSCRRDADIASHNLSYAADQFQIFRRVVFYNGITDTYILSVEGYCSIDVTGNKLSVTVKTGNGTYIKHYLGLSDNVTFFAEQLQNVNVSTDHYKVVFKPSVIIPTIEHR